MAASQDIIDDLVRNPREHLAAEIKNWIDPNSEAGKAKIVKGCIALRNHNGGYFQAGFVNGTWAPDAGNAPEDVRSAWDSDEIQRLVRNHASEAFEVHVRFAERDSQEYPVLEIEAGVQSPVAARKEIPDPDEPEKKLVERNTVYVRSLSSNGTASTTKALHGDWPALAKRCSDNREAEIGDFLRRNLDRVQVGRLARAAAEVYESMPPAQPPGAVLAEEFRRAGHERFQQEKQRRDLLYMPRHGSWEAAFVIEGEFDPPNLDEGFLNLINAANPRYSGWPVWIDSRGFYKEDGAPDEEAAPYTFEGGWEAFIHDVAGGGDVARRHIDFWRAEPAGRFYLYGAFQDDLSTGPNAPEPLTELDWVIPILRVAEVVGVAASFARAMGAAQNATLHHAFRWDGLGGRELSAWAQSGLEAARYGFVEPGRKSRQSQVLSLVSVPLDAPDSVLGRYVREATALLYSAYSGFAPPPGTVEDLTDQVLTRRF